MIRLGGATLDSETQYGLEVLVDASRLLIAESGDADLVQLTVFDKPPEPLDRWLTAPQRFEFRDGEVLVPRYVLQRVAELAGAGAEQRSTTRDRYGRVPAGENPLVRAGAWREPVVSRAGVALRDAAIRAAGRRAVRLLAPWPDGRRWAAAFTHDIDVVDWWPLFSLLRIVELTRKARLGAVARTVAAMLKAALRDPVAAGVDQLLAVEADLGVRATWFVICATPTMSSRVAGDATYHPEGKAARRLLERIRERGHEIGLHGSFATVADDAAFERERRRLEALIERPVRGVRQHFLRAEPGVTQRAMRAAGFSYDATLGFNDRGGHRLGVAGVVPAWDARRGAPIGLAEVPLTWMDRALSKYQGVEDPVKWVDEALALARSCREVEGLWVGLWHPNLTPALGFPGAPEQYRRLVQEIVGDGVPPYVAPLAAIVEWCTARRGVRASAIAQDGRIELRAAPGSAHSFVVEDERKRPQENVVLSRPHA